MRRRVVCVWLPHLAAERVLKNLPDRDRPFGIVSEESGGLRLCSLNMGARQGGLTCGMSLADARAIMPDIATAPRDEERDASFLRALGRWAQRFTPKVMVEQEEGAGGTLVLDASGCAHLFGGETGLVRELEDGLARFGLTVRIGIADTRGGAWALARFGGGDQIAPPGETRAAIDFLPTAALGLNPQSCTDLARVGLKTVRDVAALPRASIAKRFGVETVQRIDRTLGIEADPMIAMDQAAPHAVRLSLPEPIGTTDAVSGALDRLLARLCERLERERLGARQLELTIRRADGGTDRTAIGLMRPGRDPTVMASLFERGIAKLDAGFGIDGLRLHATSVEPLAAVQIVPEGDETGERLDALLARIANRIGFDAIIRMAPATSHIPERSWLRFSAAHPMPQDDWSRPKVPRPITMVGPDPVQVEDGATRRPPAALVWRGRTYRCIRATGPERIVPEWWLDDPAWRTGLRDYWRIETDSGRRFWLFHTPEVNPERTTLSRWYVHGIFA